MKSLAEQRRVERAMQGLSGGNDAAAPDPEEERLVATMERDRVVYKRDYERLRELKGEIEFMQMTLEKSRAQLTRDFESWFAIMERQAGVAAASDAAPPPVCAPQPSAARVAVAVPKQVRPAVFERCGDHEVGLTCVFVSDALSRWAWPKQHHRQQGGRC
jgi:hypothetical protein